MYLSLGEIIAGLQLLLVIPAIFIATFTTGIWSEQHKAQLKNNRVYRSEISKKILQYDVLFAMFSTIYAFCGFILLGHSESIRPPFNNIWAYFSVLIFFCATIPIIILVHYTLHRNIKFHLLTK